ncbi:UNVERIFIED_CONTAM: hypothetical protein Slati_3507200 [Sesamum latifolium]|uniref:Uncharacterized protein n=1 Tax=Sesamum latifolium TaxID=2727402 RepID=A0AAW2UIZ3_9LAMI
MISKDPKAEQTLVKETDQSIPHRPEDKDTQTGDNMMLIDPTLFGNACSEETMGLTAKQYQYDYENLANTDLTNIPLRFAAAGNKFKPTSRRGRPWKFRGYLHSTECKRGPGIALIEADREHMWVSVGVS